jgi:hypothetical protein
VYNLYCRFKVGPAQRIRPTKECRKCEVSFLNQIKKINCLAKRFIESLTTMATLEIVKEAILALKDRTGSSNQAINKWIEAEKNVS